MKHINTIEKWHILRQAMVEKGWSLWQFQYRYDSPEGFHAFFIKEGKPDVEVKTFNQEVEESIVGYNEYKRNL